MLQRVKHFACLATALTGILATAPASAVDWLMLQGTEPAGAGKPFRPFVILQPTYQADTSTITGPEPTRIGPNLDKQEQFQMQHAMLGVRGVALPIDSNVNYFLNVEFGENGATDGGKFGSRTPVRLMDASVTLNNIPGARIRLGQFKTPGPEELFQGIINMDYINFTDVTNQMMLERFPAGVTSGNGSAPLTPAEAPWTSSFGAGRDAGMEVFDSFHVGDWTHSYAVMIANGNGVQVAQSIADGPEKYLYWASEKVFGGTGPFQEGVKMFAWAQMGKRRVDLTDDGLNDPVTHSRNRYGIGARYRRGDWRVAGEYMKGTGMIFQGPEKSNMGFGTPPQLQDLSGRSDGYYMDVGYYLPSTPWEFDARYDQYNRSTDNKYISARFTTTTLGVSYHLNRKTKLTLDYAMRDDKALDPIGPGGLAAPTTALHNGLAGIKNRMAVAVTMIF